MSFPLVGNENVGFTVRSFLSADRLPHAIIISGDTGLGKHTLAKYIAKAAVCSGDNKPCGVCRGCKTNDNDNHPDITYVRREKDKKEIGVKTIRDLRAEAYVLPHEAEKRVFIIEDAEKMNVSAQNALLKILEEPPESVVFILLCSVRSGLLPTVLSRCITLALSPVLSEEGVQAVIRNAACDYSAAEALLKSTRGNIGKAIAAAGKNTQNTAFLAAKEFIDKLFLKDEYGMLTALSAAQKDRATTDLFFEELRAEICERVKTLPKNGRRARALFGLYSQLDEFSESAKLNANLSLLFCALTARASDFMR